jgi:hypothetical protein
MLVDVFGYIRRNSSKWSIAQIKRTLNEINQISKYLEQKLEGMN